ncbi:hypothetical protein Chor_008095 [Crotalus horridus]
MLQGSGPGPAALQPRGRLFPCSSEAAPRCSSPVDNDSHDPKGSPGKSQEENCKWPRSPDLGGGILQPSWPWARVAWCAGPLQGRAPRDGALRASPCTASAASPCAWNVCVARKAPLVASDSSSSGGSDSEEEEETASVATETISTGSGQEAVPLTVEAKSEKALFTRCGSGQQGAGAECPKALWMSGQWAGVRLVA